LISFAVLDCSVILSCCFVDEQDDYGMTVVEQLSFKQAFVPVICPLEFQNALLTAERRGRITAIKRRELSMFINNLNIVVDSFLPAFGDFSIAALAAKYFLSIYDASYLELAVRLSLPLATLDRKLRDAAAASGAGIYKPGSFI
jgi:predicted nucleic acid-binding protein